MGGAQKQKKRKGIVKERDCEDWCFICKDGGDLILCDYRDCLKVYHQICLDDSTETTREHWTCKRHSCLKCDNPSKFHCYCCPNAVCGRCTEAAEFAHVRGNKGLCSECLDLVLMVEEKVDLDSDKGKVDLSDRNTYECLFLEYWDIIKGEEGLSLEDVYAAEDKLKKGNSSKCSFKSKKISKGKRDIELTSSDSDLNDTEEFEITERWRGTKTVEFKGWGSKPLIEFLQSLGKDTTKELSQYDVHSIVCEYIQEKRLFDPKKKKRISCDEKLFSIFRRRFINKNKIYSLLEAHVIENLDQSDEDDNMIENENCFYNKTEKSLASHKKQRIASSNRMCHEMEAPAAQESCFASIVSENIKLVYLRRSLVEQLLNDPESFKKKVVGSFVRVKSDRRDCMQRNSYQLLQVAGMNETSINAENNGEVILQLSNVPKDVSISMLSDVDFCEEEIDELRKIVEKGVLQKPTVVELEEKAKFLHEDITKDWIEKELVRLQNHIDFANEKGWRRELHEYLEQLELLKKPSEQERLIKKAPKVIAELVEHKTSSVELIEDSPEEHD